MMLPSWVMRCLQGNRPAQRAPRAPTMLFLLPFVPFRSKSLPRKYGCVMSEMAKNWTIHGLWPSDVQECCPYWRLFPSDLTSLVPELNRHWPTFTNLSNFQFWAFEKAEIIPSCRQSYQLRTFVGALESLLGRQFQLQCVTDRQGRQLLVQIQVSLFSNFSTGCVAEPPAGISPYHPCRPQSGILYVSPNQKDPRHPCP
ncbi:ribonuclease T2-like isoform X3 [Thamnophis elegans]|uniref:ribonuclease T2-like isoform X3 n=1 Tax=Thamnophis elegans TaxID=35005 RepID=UPI001377416A|nr:ribonuclease T2-like isoform X3 [Thamnophis elegans]